MPYIVLKVVAWTVIVLGGFNIVAGPFYIGKDFGKRTAGQYLVQMILCMMYIALAGAVLGWWG